ncbi:hypothetical protein GCM10011512_21080 [Tersicoccus solisilvae]|uniref:Uncharacterized protein n=1 Tax=Tersicoccus solisilvae TaxID=1882339 RepID=A0ABQ1P9J7_9MICC|nr:hypothetical protein [Tersicoccus solisilvae]GGC93840.1 hypothetical protein GCM10011512_21080 [Tersicoccus solisilvae]
MQIRPEDQPDDTRDARRSRGSSSPTEPIRTTPTDRTQPLDLDGGAPTQATPTQPIARSSRDRDDKGPDYSNWYDSDLYVGDDDADDRGAGSAATRPLEGLDRGRGGNRDRADAAGREPVGARTEAFDRPTGQPAGGNDDGNDDGRGTTAPQPISSERAAWDEDQDDYPEETDRAAGYSSDRRLAVDEDRDAYAATGRAHRTGIGAKLGLLVLGLLLAVIAAALLGMNGQAATGTVRPGGAFDGGGLLALLGFGAGVLCVAIVIVAGRVSSTAPLMGSIIALPALAAMVSGDAAALVRGQLTAWSVPAPVAEAFLRPETALAGVLLFLIGLAFSTRRRAEDLAGPVSSFFLGLFSAICFAPGLALFCLATQENLLQAFARVGWPAPDATRPIALVLGLVLMAIGVACTSRAPGGMVVSGVVILVLAAATGFAFLATSTALPAGAAEIVQRDVTATAPLAAVLAGVSLVVASFAGLSLGRDPEPANRY